MFPACIFCQSLSHHTNNYPYWSSRVLHVHKVLTNHKPYPIFVPTQSPILNIQNLIIFLTLPNVVCRKSIIPHVFIPFTRNVME